VGKKHDLTMFVGYTYNTNINLGKKHKSSFMNPWPFQYFYTDTKLGHKSMADDYTQNKLNI
jgi:hypothetical protein